MNFENVFDKELEKKQREWLTNMKKEEPGQGSSTYLAILRVEDDWYFLNNGEAEPIFVFKVMLDTGHGLFLDYDFSVEREDENPLWTEVVVKKDEHQMILADKSGHYAFGMPEIRPPAKSVLFYVRTALEHVLVSASYETCTVNIFDGWMREVVDEIEFSMENPLLR